MSFKTRPVVIGTTDTLIYECPATLEAAGKLAISNVTGSAATYTAKFYDASAVATITIADAVSVAANTVVPFPLPPSWEQGDILYMSASDANTLVSIQTITQSDLSPSAIGFVPSGAYSAGTTYERGEWVSHEGTSYVSRVDDNTGNTPASSPTQWQIVAGKGDAGADGTDGETFVWAGNYAAGTTYAAQEFARDGGAIWMALQETTGNAPPTLPTESNAHWTLVVKDGDLTWAVVWAAADGYNLGNLTGTVALDFDDFLGMARGVVTGNVTLGEPSNLKPGQTGTFDLAMDGTGGWTLAVNGTYWVTEGGVVPEWDNTANARNILGYQVLHDGKVFLTLVAAGVE